MSDRPKGIRRKHWKCIVHIEELEFRLRGSDYLHYGPDSLKREVDIFASWEYGLCGFTGGYLKPRYRTLFIPV